MSIALVPALLLALAPGPSETPDVRYAMLIGHATGRPEQARLRYAHRDAARMRDRLSENGRFAPGRTMLLTDPDPATVDRAFAELGRRI